MGVHKLREDSASTTAAQDIGSGKPWQYQAWSAKAAVNDGPPPEEQGDCSLLTVKINGQDRSLPGASEASSAPIPWIPPLPINELARLDSTLAKAMHTPLATAGLGDVNTRRLPSSHPLTAEQTFLPAIIGVSADDFETCDSRKEGWQSNGIIRAEIGDPYEEISIASPTHVPTAARGHAFAGPRSFAGHLWKRAP